ncbi:MAG: hypothetical protein AVDCRST_MAG27-4270, partial [uncultured Craurococcus sp.]
ACGRRGAVRPLAAGRAPWPDASTLADRAEPAFRRADRRPGGVIAHGTSM